MENFINSNNFANSLSHQDRKYFYKLSLQEKMEFITLMYNVSASDVGISVTTHKLQEEYKYLGIQIKELINDGKIEIKGFDKDGKIIVIVNDDK